MINIKIKDLLFKAIELNASDLYISCGAFPTARCANKLIQIDERFMKQVDLDNMFIEMNSVDCLEKVINDGEIDFTLEIDKNRFRFNVYKQLGSISMAIRVIPSKIPNLDELKLPQIVKKITKIKSGLILITGPTGSGKSTTLASILNQINDNEEKQIITIEDPVEYVHKNNKSIINQRQVGQDTKSYDTGLKAALRQRPDIIMLGEIRDCETMTTVLKAAETGHVVFSTLHTLGCVNALDRAIDMFNPADHYKIRTQLSSVCRAILSQQLIPFNGFEQIVALESLIMTPGIKNLIRDGKNHQIHNSIQTGKKYDMFSMDQYLVNLYKRKIISLNCLYERVSDCEYIDKIIKNNGGDDHCL